MSDQPRWPAGTPVAPSGRGPGGGRYRSVGRPGVGGWVALLGARLSRGWANDEASRLELERIASDDVPLVMVDEDSDEELTEPGYPTIDIAGGAGLVLRVDLPDGRSVVLKDYGSGGGAEVEDQEAEGAWSAVLARAEVVAAKVAQAVGALVPPVVRSPDNKSAVWMGYVDGRLGWHSRVLDDDDDDGGLSYLDPYDGAAGSDAWRLGLLDLLIANNDRHGGNWLWTEQGRIFGIDHGNADALIGGGLPPPAGSASMVHDSPFADLYFRGIAFAPSPLHPGDLEVVAERLRKLHADGVLDQGEFDYMSRVLELLRPRARGDRRLIL